MGLACSSCCCYFSPFNFYLLCRCAGEQFNSTLDDNSLRSITLLTLPTTAPSREQHSPSQPSTGTGSLNMIDSGFSQQAANVGTTIEPPEVTLEQLEAGPEPQALRVYWRYGGGRLASCCNFENCLTGCFCLTWPIFVLFLFLIALIIEHDRELFLRPDGSGHLLMRGALWTYRRRVRGARDVYEQLLPGDYDVSNYLQLVCEGGEHIELSSSVSGDMPRWNEIVAAVRAVLRPAPDAVAAWKMHERLGEPGPAWGGTEEKKAVDVSEGVSQAQ